MKILDFKTKPTHFDQVTEVEMIASYEPDFDFLPLAGFLTIALVGGILLPFIVASAMGY